VTELDLRQSLIPAALIEHLATVMPTDTTGEGYDYHSFLDVLVNGTAGNGNGNGRYNGNGSGSPDVADDLDIAEVGTRVGRSRGMGE